jgi:hypothetical protein
MESAANIGGPCESLIGADNRRFFSAPLRYLLRKALVYLTRFLFSFALCFFVVFALKIAVEVA